MGFSANGPKKEAWGNNLANLTLCGCGLSTQLTTWEVNRTGSSKSHTFLVGIVMQNTQPLPQRTSSQRSDWQLSWPFPFPLKLKEVFSHGFSFITFPTLFMQLHAGFVFCVIFLPCPPYSPSGWTWAFKNQKVKEVITWAWVIVWQWGGFQIWGINCYVPSFKTMAIIDGDCGWLWVWSEDSLVGGDCTDIQMASGRELNFEATPMFFPNVRSKTLVSCRPIKPSSLEIHW